MSDIRTDSATTLMEPERLNFRWLNGRWRPDSPEKLSIISDRYFFFFGEMIMII